jgi:type VI secretion system secreted protein VgrG
MRLTTPLGPDRLLPIKLEGSEAISELYRFTVDLVGEVDQSDFGFEDILGKPVKIEIDATGDSGADPRTIHGVFRWFSQMGKDDQFVHYQAELVPVAAFLGYTVRSRIFQQKTVPEILKEVFGGVEFESKVQGAFEPRDYCVQYRESDLDFASRLMEEEGIFYYFSHGQGSAKLVLGNTPQGHSKVPAPDEILYRAENHRNANPGCVKSWQKAQSIVTGQVALWDHCFEMPGKNFETKLKILTSIAIGTKTHALTAGGGDKFELYDYPGGFSGRFDGIDPGGGEQAGNLSKIFDDSKRTAGIRMQEIAATGVRVYGSSDCPQLTPGHTFTLAEHFDADGEYLVTRVEHRATLSNQAAGGQAFEYRNAFECMPKAMPFRPEQVTPKPTVQGAQTATVVGPPGEEIFTDKYGRVKVQFHWDRDGRQDSKSSCWIRVGTPWAGSNWGMIHIPRVGQEVIVDYLEGDPDQPIIVGSVYNAEQMPPWKLPDNKTQSGILSRSSKGGGAANANALRFEDKKGSEQVWLHAEKNQDIEVENDETHWVGHDRKKTIDNDETTLVKHDRTETVDNNETITVKGNRTETVMKDEKITVNMNRTRMVAVNEQVTVGAARTVQVATNQTLVVGTALTITVGAAMAMTVGGGMLTTIGAEQVLTVGDSQTINVANDVSETVGGGMVQEVAKACSLKVGEGRATEIGKDESLKVGKTMVVDAGDEIVLKTGSASITMKKDGTITMKGKDITIEGSGKITAKASGDMILKGAKIGAN